MSEGQFRFAFFTPAYDATVAFYRDGLELPIFEDVGSQSRGSRHDLPGRRGAHRGDGAADR